MEKINGKTTICAVFGDPVAHSFSPAMHNAAYQALGMNCVYVACHVRAGRLQDAVQALRALGFRGANVTIPHKQPIAAYLDELCGDARRSGSVNTIVNRDDRLLGYSTDGVGFVRSLQDEAGYELSGKNILILGAGGSAVALIHRLIDSGIGSLTVVNRNFDKAVNLQERIWLDTRFEMRIKGLDELEAFDVQSADLLINTTSVGQGAESFRLWFETEPPIAAMREALERVLR
jgi:shikimate dehydrogenase